MSEIYANFCDGCGDDLAWGEIAYMLKTGKTDPDLQIPVVKILCAGCYVSV